MCETQSSCGDAEIPSLLAAKVCSGRFTGKSKIIRSGEKVSRTSGSPTNRKLTPFIAVKQLTACPETTTSVAVNANNGSTSQPSPLYVLLELCSISCTRLPGALAAESISYAEAEGVMCVSAGGCLPASATDLCGLPAISGGNPPHQFERRAGRKLACRFRGIEMNSRQNLKDSGCLCYRAVVIALFSVCPSPG